MIEYCESWVVILVERWKILDPDIVRFNFSDNLSQVSPHITEVDASVVIFSTFTAIHCATPQFPHIDGIFPEYGGQQQRSFFFLFQQGTSDESIILNSHKNK